MRGAPDRNADMDWTTAGGFVALAALTVGLIRDVKRGTRRQFEDSRAENRETHARTNQRIDELRAENREAHARTNQRIDELRAETNQRFCELRAEVRGANMQTNQRIDDLRATVVAIVPRAAAEPVDAPPVRGS